MGKGADQHKKRISALEAGGHIITAQTLVISGSSSLYILRNFITVLNQILYICIINTFPLFCQVTISYSYTKIYAAAASFCKKGQSYEPVSHA